MAIESNINNSLVAESFSDLWDGYDVVTKSSEKGVLLLKDVIRFFKKRIMSEDEYSKSLSKLVLKFEPQAPDGFVGARLKNTWDQIRLETLTHSNYHETICTNIQTHIIEPIEGLIVDLEQKLKAIHVDAEKVFMAYQESVAKLKKHKANYDRLCKDSFEITGVSKGETQKVQKRAIKAAQDVIKADKEYRGQINETNGAQKVFLSESIPKIMNDLQRLEMIRIHMVKSFFLRYFKSIEGMPQKFSTEHDSLVQLIQLINNEEEIQEFVRKVKPSHKYPKPFEYEPYLDKQVYPTPSPPVLSSSPTQTPSYLYPSSPSSTSSYNGNSSNSASVASTTSTISADCNNNNNTPTKKPGWNLKRFSTNLTAHKSSTNIKSNNGTPTSGGSSNSSNSSNLFTCNIEDLMNEQKKKYPNTEVPYLLIILKDKLKQLDAYKTQGIFRVPGNVIDINNLKKRFGEGNYEIAVNENVYTVASLLKSWLREIPDPLFAPTVYEQCLVATKKEEVQEIIDSLPLLNQKIISYIVTILQEAILPENVEVSKMNSDNLAMVFSPCFLRSPYTDPNILLGNIFKEKEFVKCLIDTLVPLSVNENIQEKAVVSPPSSPLSRLPPPPASPTNSGIKANSTSSVNNTLSPTTSASANSTSSLGTPNNITGKPTFKSDLLSPIAESPSADSGKRDLLPNPKIAAIKMESAITTPVKNPDGSISLQLMSPSEVKKRCDDSYLDNQEKVKELIDNIHTSINELYSDVTTIELTSYFAMQASLLIAKFTRSLEQFLTVDWKLTLADVIQNIDKNKFVSPPAIHFKIPSKLPKLLPVTLLDSDSTCDTLRDWLSTITLTINRVNEYLCYFGGVVMRIHSPETLESIRSLFSDIEMKPVDNPKFAALSAEQASLLIQKTLPLISPLNPFTQEELNINIKVLDTITPVDTPPFASPSNHSTYINKNAVDPLSGGTMGSLLTVPNKGSSGVNTPPSSNNINSSSNNTVSPYSSSPLQFSFDIPHGDDDSTLNSSGMDSDEDEIDLIEYNNKFKKLQVQESNQQIEAARHQQQQLHRSKTFEIIEYIKEQKKCLNQLDMGDPQAQTDMRMLAKFALSLKRDLDEFVNNYNESNDKVIEVELENDPVINKDNDSCMNLKIMTNHFMTRIIIILTTIHSYSSTNANLSLETYNLLSKYPIE
ncbi:hypothetical protein CYY_007049 [Polysphondylium violaceum]|uniref:RhoGAP domain-containing protein n=1 Tax=Polysphondylium violaceum TaxID=133409 RepID=A0A8J4UR56_9MYCE|nr:hypothetical protein CYY_007049 [Polysphondylium violaceum]